MEEAHSHFRRSQPRPAWFAPGLQILGDNYAPVPQPYIAEGGFAYPGGRLTGNAWDTWDFDSTTNLATVTDMTSAVQAAHDQLAARGLGGTIMLGPGVWRINGVSITSPGIRVIGAGWGEYQGAHGASSPAKRSKLGTYVLTDSATPSAFTFGAAANACVISDLAFIQPQTPEGGGWTPRVFAPCITITGAATFGGSVLIERCLFWGVYQPIKAGSAGSAVGRLTVRDCELASFSGFLNPNYTGSIQVLAAYDVTIDSVNFYADLLQGSTNQQAYMASNAYAFEIQANAATIANCSVFGAQCGFLFDGNYPSSGGLASSRLKLLGTTLESVTLGIMTLASVSTNVSLIVDGLTCLGTGSSGSGSALNFGGSGLNLGIDNFYLTYFPGCLLVCLDTTAKIKCGPNARFDSWNQNTSGNTALNATAGAHVWYSSALTEFTNGGGAANTSGGGTFTAY